MDRALVERIVSEVIRRLSGETRAHGPQQTAPTRLVTEEAVQASSDQGMGEIVVARHHVVTPLAQDALRRTGIVLSVGENQSNAMKSVNLCVGVGADRRGQALLDVVKRSIPGREIVDIGQSEGFVEIARDVALAVAGGRCGMGIILGCGGDASAMVANKIHGVRAVACHDATSAKYARAHLDANVLCVGVVGDTTAKEILETWLSTPFDANTHGGYLRQIRQLEDHDPPE